MLIYALGRLVTSLDRKLPRNLNNCGNSALSIFDSSKHGKLVNARFYFPCSVLPLFDYVRTTINESVQENGVRTEPNSYETC